MKYSRFSHWILVATLLAPAGASAAWTTGPVLELDLAIQPSLSFGLNAELERTVDVETPLAGEFAAGLAMPAGDTTIAFEVAFDLELGRSLAVIADRPITDTLAWQIELGAAADASEVTLVFGLLVAL